jgi:cyclopropane fatty-acyl-phospholipid synthase-like methyltransferase
MSRAPAKDTMTPSDAVPAPFDDPVGHWNARFAAPGFLFGEAPNATLVEQAARFAPGDRVLCVADGEGRNSCWLAERGCHVTAFDVSPVAVDKARRLAAERGVEVDHQVAGVADWNWRDGRYDAVVAVFVQFADPVARRAMFSGFAEALRPDGLLLLVGYGTRQLEYRTGGPGRLDHLYTEDMLRESFAGWSIERLVRADRILQEGPGHHGMSDVIELLARKKSEVVAR